MKRGMSYLQYILTSIHIHQGLTVYEFILINFVLVTSKHYLYLKRLVKSSDNLIVLHIATTAFEITHVGRHVIQFS